MRVSLKIWLKLMKHILHFEPSQITWQDVTAGLSKFYFVFFIKRICFFSIQDCAHSKDHQHSDIEIGRKRKEKEKEKEMARSLSRQPTWAVFIEKDKNQEMYIESRQCKCCTKPLFQRLTDTVDDLLHLAAFANRKLVPSSPLPLLPSSLRLKASFWSPMVALCIMEEWTLNHFFSVSCVDNELLKHLSLFFVVRQISADFQFPKRGRLAIFNFQTSISTSISHASAQPHISGNFSDGRTDGAA